MSGSAGTLASTEARIEQSDALSPAHKQGICMDRILGFERKIWRIIAMHNKDVSRATSRSQALDLREPFDLLIKPCWRLLHIISLLCTRDADCFPCHTPQQPTWFLFLVASSHSPNNHPPERLHNRRNGSLQGRLLAPAAERAVRSHLLLCCHHPGLLLLLLVRSGRPEQAHSNMGEGS